MENKRRFAARWPDRQYKLIPDSVVAQADGGAPNFIKVEFRYAFRTAGANGARSGRGVGNLVLTKREGGQFVVAAENGSVEQWD